ncbi:DUF3017 domain-containing protein [Streptomyces sp. NPDC006551]|uniref:DUF3017 domain-containing protein n=1 Tax=Streptomyces sp. NPDC006551 TaxID=3157178 RepID=UPI0033B6AFB5
MAARTPASDGAGADGVGDSRRPVPKAPRGGAKPNAGAAGAAGAPGPEAVDAPGPEAAAEGAGVDGLGVDEPGIEGSRAAGAQAATGAASARSRRPPAMTTDTARPEGGGRAAAGDAPAPARQWPLLTVLGLAALGLLVVGTDLFPQSFRVGTLLVGVALLTGAGLRRALPSVGMLAVRSRFTDMITYGLMGTLIVLLALMVQPAPWLRIPFLEDVLHLTIT